MYFTAAGASPNLLQDRSDTRHTVPIVQNEDLLVRLEVRPQASLADEEWMSFAFENTADRPLVVKNAYYRIESERQNLKTRQTGGSGSLASGNTYDLFPDAWKTTPVAPIILKSKSTYRMAQQPSDYSAALLGMPPEGGWRIHARLHLNLDLEDGRHFKTPNEGIPFDFEWLYPTETGFQTMRHRLKKLLESPEPKAYHSYILGAFLGITELTQGITRDELLDGLRHRSGSFDGRETVAKYLDKAYPEDSVVLAYYLEELKRGNAVVLGDLLVSSRWAPELLEPLILLYESDARRQGLALYVLHHRRDAWVTNPAVVKRLSAAVFGAFPVLKERVRELPNADLERWATAVSALSMTGDLSVIESLLPGLDDRRAFRSSRRMALASAMRLPPLRVCDCVLDAVLTLLDGSPDQAYHDVAPSILSRVEATDLDSSWASVRDRMIIDLKRRLDHAR